MTLKAENWMKFWCTPQFGGRVELSRGIGVTHVYPWHWHEEAQVRISRARVLLNEGKPLHVVAAETGFADQSHFTREFKRYIGLTPGAYRSHQPGGPTWPPWIGDGAEEAGRPQVAAPTG